MCLRSGAECGPQAVAGLAATLQALGKNISMRGDFSSNPN